MNLCEQLNKELGIEEAKDKQASAVITKNNASKKEQPLDLAFADSQDGKIKGIAITPNTKIRDDNKGKRDIASLKVGEKIAIEYKDTSRGMEATIVAFN